MLRYEWVWYKERGTGFLNANRAPLKKSENILVFYQKSPVYHPQFTYGKPYTRTHTSSGMSTNYGKFVRQGSGTTVVAALNVSRHFICLKTVPVFFNPATELLDRRGWL